MQQCLPFRRLRPLALLCLLAFTASPAAAATPLPVAKPVIGCGNLAATDLTDIGGAGSKVSSASEASSGGVAVCKVEGTLAPSIGFRVLLPTTSWTQRYLQVGCGGLCGDINLEAGAASGCVPLGQGGFAVAATDMGHTAAEGDTFGADPQKRADFAFRAQHLTAEAAKRLIAAFYGRRQAFSYFSGCSDGGREALIEAQRFPDDFDGIIAGAAALNFQAQNGLYHSWLARSNTNADGHPIVLADRLPILHKAVLAACDTLDGLADGLIANPFACRFDPATIACAGNAADRSNCLTAEEVAAVAKFYAGPRDAKTGKRLIAGGPQFGSELAWAGVFVPEAADRPIFSEMIALQALKGLIFETNPSPDFTLADLAFDEATFDRMRALHPLYDATNPDLSRFAASGGKLILYHGWADPHISPINTISYHTAVEARLGRERTAAFERLYLMAGMYHCSNGEGPSQFDLLTPMMEWVEAGKAPDAIVAHQPEARSGNAFGQPAQKRQRPEASPYDGAKALSASGIVRSRPVYPYPALATYDGQGDPNVASSFRAGDASIEFAMPDWAGADFFQP